MRVDRAVGFPRGHAADDVADGERAGTVPLGLAQGAQCVRGLAGLRDGDRQRPAVDERLPIAILRAVVHVDGNPGELLNQELADQTGMPGRAAAQDQDAIDRPERGGVQMHLFEEHPARLRRGSAEHGLADRPRLLVDFLQHEMRVARLLRHHRIPGDVSRRLGDRPAAEVRKHDACPRHNRDLAIVQEGHVARVFEKRRRVGGHEGFAVAKANDDRRSVPHGNDRVGIVGGNQHQGEETTHVPEGPAHRGRQPVAPTLLLHQMGDDLSVGLGDEAMALRLEVVLQLEVVLDDAVVDDDNAAVAVGVRMRVFLGRTAVSRPPRVADAELAVDRIPREHVVQS